MLEDVGRCSSCGEQRLQIRENVNKRIGMCENLILFCLSCKEGYLFFSYKSSSRKGKEKGNDEH